MLELGRGLGGRGTYVEAHDYLWWRVRWYSGGKRGEETHHRTHPINNRRAPPVPPIIKRLAHRLEVVMPKREFPAVQVQLQQNTGIA